MSRKPSHIPFFPDAYLRDNYRLSLEQHGLFLIMLMEAWSRQDCSLPGDDESLAAIAQIPVAKFRKICGPVLSQWTRNGEKIFQGRLIKEWRYVREKSEKARASVGMRKDRAGYVRTSNVGTNDLHLGGGEGVLAEGKDFIGDDVGGDADARTPFDVIRGGRT